MPAQRAHARRQGAIKRRTEIKRAAHQIPLARTEVVDQADEFDFVLDLYNRRRVEQFRTPRLGCTGLDRFVRVDFKPETGGLVHLDDAPTRAGRDPARLIGRHRLTRHTIITEAFDNQHATFDKDMLPAIGPRCVPMRQAFGHISARVKA